MTTNPSRCVLFEQYAMMKKGEFCDFRISVQDLVIPVHKMVLAARSLYFRTLFSSQMAECEENLLRLTDIEPDDFQQLLKYLYTCEFDDPLDSEEALKFILHGEKYGIKELVDACELDLLASINIWTAARCLLAANLLKREKLKSEALSVLKKNWSEAFTTEGWNDVLSTKSLITEIEIIECAKLHRNELQGKIHCDSDNGAIEWHIENTSFNTGNVESPPFSLFEEEEFSWKLIVLHTNRTCKLKLLHIGSPMINSMTCSFAVSTIVDSGTRSELCVGSFDTTCCFQLNSQCEIDLMTFPEIFPPYGKHPKLNIKVAIKNCSENVIEASSMDYLSEYLEKSCLTDATITVDGETFSIHKIILSVNSPVFRELLQKKDNILLLDEEMDNQTFRILLLIIYQSQNIPDFVNFNLLDAARRYRLSNKLLNRCRALLFRSMKDTRLVEFVIKSHARHDKVLKGMAFKKMIGNMASIQQSAYWKLMNSDLHDEFFRYIISRKYPVHDVHLPHPRPQSLNSS